MMMNVIMMNKQKRKKMKTHTLNKILILLVMGSSVSIAEPQANRGRGGNQQEPSYNKGIIQGIDIPVSPSAQNLRVERNRLEMGTAKKAKMYKNTQIKRIEREKILAEVFDPAILMKPISRVIRSIDTVGLSPLYISQIVMPEQMVITDAKASFSCSILEFSNNLMRIKPDEKTFFAGNIVLTMTDGRKNYTMTVFAERYYQQDCKIDAGQYICRRGNQVFTSDKAGTGDYTYTYNNLSTFYVYTNPAKIGDMEAIIMYEKLQQKLLNISRDGDYVSFEYRGIFYDIKRDDSFGKINYRGKKYTILPRG